MTVVPDLYVWVAVWLAAALFVLYRHWFHGHGAGLMLGYIVSFGAIHWLSSALYLLPWYTSVGVDITAFGMRVSAIAMVAFAVGAELMGRLLERRERRSQAEVLEDSDEPVDSDASDEHDGAGADGHPDFADGATVSDRRVVTFYLIAGAILHLVLFPAARGIPSVAALVGTGSTLVVMAIGLKCWMAWHGGHGTRMWMWVLSTTVFPFFTVITQGFLGYGLAAMLTVLAFVAAFYRPRWRIVVVGCLLGYLGLSVYVTYMRDRAQIRSAVWGGSSFDDRLDQIETSLREFEWFDIRDPQHLWRIDDRLNQNLLLGTSILFIGDGRTSFAHGATIVDALWNIVPRAVWRDKPTTAGSGDLVSNYTGLHFAEGTSVGIGQVMELYVNAGTPAVIIGFLLIGGVLIWLEHVVIAALEEGNVARFALFYLPGLALLNVGGSFVEGTSMAAAGLAVAIGLGRLTDAFAPRPIAPPQVLAYEPGPERDA
jgi:hypothetical protein